MAITTFFFLFVKQLQGTKYTGSTMCANGGLGRGRFSGCGLGHVSGGFFLI